MEIVRIHAGLCVAADLIPIPLLGSVAVAGVQVQMVESLARHYGIPCRREQAGVVIQALGFGAAHAAITRGLATRNLEPWLFALPVVGTPFRLLTWPALLAAFTYRLGKSYVDHFESGGRADDFQRESLLQSQLVPLPL